MSLNYTVTIEIKNLTPLLSFGNNSSIGEYSHITCINRINIGNNVEWVEKFLLQIILMEHLIMNCGTLHLTSDLYILNVRYYRR